MSTPADLPEYVTITDVAKRYVVSDDTVRRWIQRSQLRAVRLPSGAIRIPAADADALGTPIQAGA